MHYGVMWIQHAHGCELTGMEMVAQGVTADTLASDQVSCMVICTVVSRLASHVVSIHHYLVSRMQLLVRSSWSLVALQVDRFLGSYQRVMDTW